MRGDSVSMYMLQERNLCMLVLCLLAEIFAVTRYLFFSFLMEVQFSDNFLRTVLLNFSVILFYMKFRWCGERFLWWMQRRGS